jgi:hypothetical protein
MSTVNQAIDYCNESGKTHNAVLFERCRKSLMRGNIEGQTESEKWGHILEESDMDIYPTLCMIADMRFE